MRNLLKTCPGRADERVRAAVAQVVVKPSQQQKAVAQAVGDKIRIENAIQKMQVWFRVYGLLIRLWFEHRSPYSAAYFLVNLFF